MTIYFIQSFIYLMAAVIIVPLAKRAGLGSVLGYLIAGVIIGPLLGLVGQETNTIQHFAEFGVVMMLFLVGLELEPNVLWRMKSKLLGFGGLQILLTSVVLGSITFFLGQSWQVSIAIGLILSLSSTAIILQTFNEKKLTNTEGGKNAFSVLLFQDIAVIPILAFIPLLGAIELINTNDVTNSGKEHSMNMVANLSTSMHAMAVIGVILGVIFLGHFFSRALFNYVAKSGLREIFVATALMLVIGISALMGLVGLSPALGAFLAGVVLANSEFRHELESNIEPFKGLLLGLFFITVGAGVDFEIFLQNINFVLIATLGVMAVKAVVLLAITVLFNIKGVTRWLFALSLAQAGEFGFVLINYSFQNNVLPAELSQKLQLVVALSMFLTPLLFIILEKYITPKFQQKFNKKEADEITEEGNIIIAGIGRFGQVINRFLVSNNIKTVVLDHEATQIENMRKINIKSFFGDATRPELLHSAGAESASMIVIAIDDKEASVELTKYLKLTYSHVKILARAFDRGHSYELREAGADIVISETYHSAMEAGGNVLEHLGIHSFQVKQKKNVFQKMEQKISHDLFDKWKEGSQGEQFSSGFRKLFIQFELYIKEQMAFDGFNQHSKSERGWTPPPKDYVELLKQKHEESILNSKR